MLTTVPPPPPPPPSPDCSEVAAPPPPAESSSSSPQAASSAPAPATPANAPADLATKPRRVEGPVAHGASSLSPCLNSLIPHSSHVGRGPSRSTVYAPHRSCGEPHRVWPRSRRRRTRRRRGVPRDQEPLQRHHGQVQDEAEERQAEDHGEQPLRLEVVEARHDLVAEPLVPAEILADDRADHGEDDPDLHAREDVGQRARVLEPPERLPPGRVEAFHHVLLPLVDGADPEDRVQEHWEERDHRDDDD